MDQLSSYYICNQWRAKSLTGRRRRRLSLCPIVKMSSKKKKNSHVCKESPTASRAILHRHTVSRGSGGTRGNNGKRVFKSQRWICVMIVNDVFPCPLRQTVRPNLYSCFLFVTVRATDVCPCLLLGQSMSHWFGVNRDVWDVDVMDVSRLIHQGEKKI